MSRLDVQAQASRRGRRTPPAGGRRKTGRAGRARWFPAVFPAALLYYELALRLFTGGEARILDILALALLCCAYGGLGYLLCTIARSRRVNFWLAAALLLLTALPYGVEAFLYRAFKVFYSFDAIFAGTGDVMGDFSSEIVRLVFSPGGLLCVAVFLLPAVLFAALGAVPGRIGGRRRGMAAARMVAFFLLGLALIRLVPSLSLAYGEEYNFQSAVARFGLLTGARLDMEHALFDRGGGQFQLETDLAALEGRTAPSPTPEPAADETAASPVPDGSPAPEATESPRVTVLDNGRNELGLPLDEEPKGWSDRVKDISAYVATQTASSKNEYTGIFKGKNLIMITAEAFSGYVIDPELTPTLYRMATKGVNFTDYYQFAGAGTTGGEYQHIFGLLPSNGLESMRDMTGHKVQISMPAALAAQGYYGKAYHNSTYTFYDRDKTHTSMGFSDGYMGIGNGLEEVVTVQWPESDYEMFAGTLPTYIDKQPFNTYYMTVSGHSPYIVGSNKMSAKHWDQVSGLSYSSRVKAYIAACLDLEDAMTYLIEQLEAKGIADDTVICLTPDHFPYGLDDGASLGSLPYLSELYGERVNDVFARDRSCWLLWCGSLEDDEPIVVDEPTFSLDVLPTLLNLFGIDFDSRLLPGRDVFSDAPALVFDLAYDWKTPYGTYTTAGGFVPAEGVDEAEIPAGYEDDILAVVRNKVNFCQGILNRDYYTYLFWR